MAATDIPPTPFVLRIAGLKGDPATGGFNVQSFDLALEKDVDPAHNRDITLTRVVDGASPTISAAFALLRNVANDATLAVIDASGAEVVSYRLIEPRVTRYELTAAVGGNERATESIQLTPSQLTITSAKTKRTTVL